MRPLLAICYLPQKRDSNLVDFFVGVDLDDGVSALVRHLVEVSSDRAGREDLVKEVARVTFLTGCLWLSPIGHLKGKRMYSARLEPKQLSPSVLNESRVKKQLWLKFA